MNVFAGAAGISYARNMFARDDPKDFITKIKRALNSSLV